MTVRGFYTERLGESAASESVAFVVLLGAGRRTFIRVLAHYKDDEVLGGTPPTVLITTGEGPVAAVTDGDEGVPVIGSDQQTVVATAACARTEDNDTYLVVIAHDKDAGPWSFVVRNEEVNPLQFFGFVSDVEAETVRPWMQLEGTREKAKVLISSGTADILVRNVGTAALELDGSAGDQIDGTPIVLVEMPAAPIRPHRSGRIRVSRGGQFDGTRSETLTFASNDPDRSHGEIAWAVTTGPEPELEPKCGLCVCRNFWPRQPPDQVECRNCGHQHSWGPDDDVNNPTPH